MTLGNKHGGRAVCPKTGKILNSTKKYRWIRWFFPITGLLALIWFLIRVIPKPSRALYPCQRVAAPIASGFVVWILGLAGSVSAFRRSKQLLAKSRYLVASICIFVGVLAVYIPISYNSASVKAAVEPTWYEPNDPCNTPIGVGKGIYPGRVVWVYEPNSTSWDGTSNYWWSDENTDHNTVADMLTNGLCDLTEEANTVDAWDALFKNFNENHGKGAVGYQSGEKIAIKLNMNMIASHTETNNDNFPAPQLVLALLRQLVYDAGVNDNDITFYDVTRHIHDVIYDRCKAEFPDVNFVDWVGGDGRQQYVRDLSVQVHWSDDLKDPTESGGGFATYLPTCLTQAEYLINFANLKGHRLAGITVCAKNHYGSICADSNSAAAPEPAPTKSPPKGAGLHPYTAVHDYRDWLYWDMENYHPMVDIIGHEHLGGKTLLYMVDGLYADIYMSKRRSLENKWQSAPFNNDWTSSLFFSQDPVAIDSVALDFIRNEPTIQNYIDTVAGFEFNIIGEGDSVDNYLQEAALANDPPSGAPYDPETAYNPATTTTDLSSLGVHEHWNNYIDKKYTRNMRTGDGIELIRSPRIAGDIDGGGVDYHDLMFIAEQWLNQDCSDANDFCFGADISREGKVNIADYGFFADDWLKYKIYQTYSSP